ncbi:MAG: FRG domain-containing protein [Thermoanaerobaculales bacterium]
MNGWETFFAAVLSKVRTLRKAGVPDPFFRGHRHGNWKLLPSLLRKRIQPATEERLYANFQSLGGHLFPSTYSQWDRLFLMQHHGIPTRLLDWTESFAVALYFAVKGSRGSGAVWILDPYAMNKATSGDESALELNLAYPTGYEPFFLDAAAPNYGKFPAPALAVYGAKLSVRMQWQRAVFTFHSCSTPLEKLCPVALQQVVLPKGALRDARDFLLLAGSNEFTIFPDLDGLARHLCMTELS